MDRPFFTVTTTTYNTEWMSAENSMSVGPYSGSSPVLSFVIQFSVCTSVIVIIFGLLHAGGGGQTVGGLVTCLRKTNYVEKINHLRSSH